MNWTHHGSNSNSNTNRTLLQDAEGCFHQLRESTENLSTQVQLRFPSTNESIQNTHSVHATVDKLISRFLLIPEILTSDSQEVDNQRQDSPWVDSQQADSLELGKLVVEELDKLVVEVVDHKLEEDIQQLVGKADLVVTYAARVALPLVEDRTCHLSCPFQPCVVSASLIKHNNFRCKLLNRKPWKAFKLRLLVSSSIFLMSIFLTSFFPHKR